MGTTNKRPELIRRTSSIRNRHQINQREVERLTRTVHNLAQPASSTNQQISILGGQPQLLDTTPKPITIKITSGTNPYAWTQQYDDGSNTWTNLTGGLSGTTSSLPAYEVNGHNAVPADAIVQAWPGFQDSVFYFEFAPLNLTGITDYGDSTITSNAPPGRLRLPRITVPGPPTYTGVDCELICDSNGDFWIYSGGSSSWLQIDISNTTSGGGGTDEKVKVSSNDTTADELDSKLTAGDGLDWAEINDGGNETYEIGFDFSTPLCFPCWKKFTKTYSDFSTASSTNDISIYTLPIGGCVHDLVLKHTTAFTGGSITEYEIDLGIAGDLARYSPDGFPVSVFSAPNDGDATVISKDGVGDNVADVPDWGSTTDIRIQATATGDTLDNATQGVVEIYLLVSQVKS